MDRADFGAATPDGRRRPWGPHWSVERVIDALEPLVNDDRRARVLEVVDGRLDGVTLVMDAPHDPHNGAAVLRSCDAFGVARIHVVPRSEPFLVASGVTKGTDRWVEVIEHRDPEAAVRAVRNDGFTLVSTHPRGDADVEALGFIERLALVVGNEHDGIRTALEDAASRCVAIPMRGFVESLNVSVAAAILLHAATVDRSGDLSAERRRELYAVGLYRSVQRADVVLDALVQRGA